MLTTKHSFLRTIQNINSKGNSWDWRYFLIILMLFGCSYLSSAPAIANSSAINKAEGIINNLVELEKDPEFQAVTERLTNNIEKLKETYNELLKKNIDNTKFVQLKTALTNILQQEEKNLHTNLNVSQYLKEPESVVKMLQENKKIFEIVIKLIGVLEDHQDIFASLNIENAIKTITPPGTAKDEQAEKASEELVKTIKLLLDEIRTDKIALFNKLQNKFKDITIQFNAKDKIEADTLIQLSNTIIKAISNLPDESIVRNFLIGWFSKLLESVIKNSGSDNPYASFYGKSLTPLLIGFNYKLPIKSKNSCPFIAATIGKATALAMFTDKEIFYKYCLAKIAGEDMVKNKITSIFDKNSAGFPVKTAIDILIGYFENMTLEMGDFCSLGGMILEKIIKNLPTEYVPAEYRPTEIIAAAAAPIGAILVAQCRNSKRNLGAEALAQEDNCQIANDEASYCTSQLNGDGSSSVICDKNRLLQINVIQSRLYYRMSPTQDMNAYIMQISPENYGLNKGFTTVRRSDVISASEKLLEKLLEKLKDFWKFSFEKFCTTIVRKLSINNFDVPEWFRKTWPDGRFYQNTISTSAQDTPATNIFFKASWLDTKDLPKLPDDYDDLLFSYFVKNKNYRSAIGAGQVNAFNISGIRGVSHSGNNSIVELTLRSHVSNSNIHITEVHNITKNHKSGECVPNFTREITIGPKENRILELTNCEANKDYKFRTKYRIGNPISGEYYHGMIWFKYPNVDRSGAGTSRSPTVQTPVAEITSSPGTSVSPSVLADLENGTPAPATTPFGHLGDPPGWATTSSNWFSHDIFLETGLLPLLSGR